MVTDLAALPVVTFDLGARAKAAPARRVVRYEYHRTGRPRGVAVPAEVNTAIDAALRSAPRPTDPAIAVAHGVSRGYVSARRVALGIAAHVAWRRWL